MVVGEVVMGGSVCGYSTQCIYSTPQGYYCLWVLNLAKCPIFAKNCTL